MQRGDEIRKQQGKALRELMTDAGLATTRKTGRATGVTHPTIGKIFAGGHVSDQVAAKVYAPLGGLITPSEISDGKPLPPPSPQTAWLINASIAPVTSIEGYDTVSPCCPANPRQLDDLLHLFVATSYAPVPMLVAVARAIELLSIRELQHDLDSQNRRRAIDKLMLEGTLFYRRSTYLMARTLHHAAARLALAHEDCNSFIDAITYCMTDCRSANDTLSWHRSARETMAVVDQYSAKMSPQNQIMINAEIATYCGNSAAGLDSTSFLSCLDEKLSSLPESERTNNLHCLRINRHVSLDIGYRDEVAGRSRFTYLLDHPVIRSDEVLFASTVSAWIEVLISHRKYEAAILELQKYKRVIEKGTRYTESILQYARSRCLYEVDRKEEGEKALATAVELSKGDFSFPRSMTRDGTPMITEDMYDLPLELGRKVQDDLTRNLPPLNEVVLKKYHVPLRATGTTGKGRRPN